MEPPLRLPDFLVVGAAKSGTTSLYSYIKQHPLIFMPAWKEPHFFSYMDTEWDWALPAKTLHDYSHMFSPTRPGQLAGEASTTYLYEWQRTIANIRACYAGRDLPAIIIILRNPADRMLSHYNFYRIYGLETLPFDAAIAPGAAERLARTLDRNRFGPPLDYLRAGMYAEAVAGYIDAFPRTLIIWHEDLLTHSRRTVSETLAFLGLSPAHSIPCVVRYNRSGVPRSALFNRLLNRMMEVVASPPPPLQRAAERVAGGAANLHTLKRRLYPFARRFLNTIRQANIRPASLSATLRSRIANIYRDDIPALERRTGKNLAHWLP